MTLADALQYAADRLDAATQKMTAIRDQIAAQLASSTTSVQTIINSFNARPLYAQIHVDPLNGNDANDGSTYLLAKRSTDNVLGNIGSQGVNVLLYADDVVRRRHTIATNIFINGVQQANNDTGYINVLRTISFLGTAINSPSPAVGTFCAGVFFSAGQLFTASINFALPEVSALLNHRSHFASAAFLNAQLLGGTITGASAQAGALFGSFNGGRSVVTFSGVVLGANGPGHLFDQIAAGADPNALWAYSTNIKAA